MKFYRIPLPKKKPELRKKWITAISREKWREANQYCLYMQRSFYYRHTQSVPQTHFGSYFQKGKIFPIFSFWKNHIPLSKDTKFEMSLCMSLVFGASRNVSFNDDNHILKFFTEGFENLPSSFFLIPKICYRVLGSAFGRIYTCHSGSFILTFTTRWQIIMVLLFHMKQILILVPSPLLLN